MINRVNKYISLIFFLAGGINFAHIALAEEKIADGMIGRPIVEYKSVQLRDPFQPVVTQEVKKAAGGQKADLAQASANLVNVRVQGIIWGGRIPQAIVDDKVLTVGDTIQGAEILSIDKNGITVSFNGTLANLTVSGETQAAPVTPETKAPPETPVTRDRP